MKWIAARKWALSAYVLAEGCAVAVGLALGHGEWGGALFFAVPMAAFLHAGYGHDKLESK